MPSNDAHFSGQGHLIEAVIKGDPNGTVIPVVCDANGQLIIDLTAGSVILGDVKIIDAGGVNVAAVDATGDLQVDVNNFPNNQNVTVTNGTGTSAVNIQDGGNSITVDGTVAVSNFPAIQPISGSVSVSNFPVSQAVTGTFFQTTQPVSEINIDKSFGTWAYYAGTSGTVTVSGGQRVTAITAHATTAGSMTINGGATITIPANTSFSDNPQGNITAPTIVFTGTDAYFIEVVS